MDGEADDLALRRLIQNPLATLRRRRSGSGTTSQGDSRARSVSAVGLLWKSSGGDRCRDRPAGGVTEADCLNHWSPAAAALLR